MKKLLVVLLFIATTGGLFAQGSLGAFVGYGKSAFPSDFFGDGVEYDQAGYVPVGAQLLMGVGMFQLGAEVNYAALPFTFEQSSSDGTKLLDYKITQLYVGAVAKIRIGGGPGIHPYARAGAGMYMGKFKVEYTDDGKAYALANGFIVEDSEMDFKSAFGVNLGAGVEISVAPNTGIFGEAVFHMVKRELDIDGAESTSMNNFAIHVGVMFGL